MAVRPAGLLRRGACHRAGHFGPDPLAPRNDELHRSRAALFSAPRGLFTVFTNGPPIRGGGAPKGAYRGRSAHSEHWRPCGFAARAAFGGRARLPALYRGSRQVFRPGSVRSRASWQRQRMQLRPPPGQPAPGRPASWPAGRVPELPANGVTSPIPGTAPAPLQGSSREASPMIRRAG